MIDGIALLAIAAGVVALRIGWRGARWPVVGGWLAIAVGTLAFGGRWGAWGLSVACLIAMGVALLILAREAW